MTLRHVGLVALVAFVSSLAYAGEPQWVEVKSPHFSVISDAGDKRAREVAIRFEQMRAVFGALLTKATVNMPVPLQILAFRNSKEMRQFVPLWHGKPTEDSGLFLSGDDCNYILIDLSAENAWPAVFHEYGHLLLHGNTTAHFAPWFDEGFAEYFSTITVTGKEADVGKPSQNDFEVLRDTGWLRVVDLFRVQQNSSVYNESGNHRNAFYAESWLMVHYLYDTRTLPKAAVFFQLLYDNNLPVDEASRQAFGMTTAEWDKTLRQYFGRNQFLYYKLPTPPGIETTGYTVLSLDPMASKTVLADIHAHSPDYSDKAIAEFQEVLAVQPNNPAALRGLGYGYLRKRDFAHAREYFDRAAQLNTNDPRVLYYSALLLNEQKRMADHDDAEHMKDLLERSIALDPAFADAYNLLAFAYRGLGRDDDALNAMTKAISINPGNYGYRINLAEIELDKGNIDNASKILTQLKNTRDPQVVEFVTRELSRIEDYRIATAHQQEVKQAQPGLRLKETNADTHDTAEFSGPPPTPATPAGPINFLKGRLLSVDCSRQPAATLTISSGPKAWKMHAANGKKLVVIGADKLDCGWSNQKVAVNFQPTGDDTGELMSLELQ